MHERRFVYVIFIESTVQDVWEALTDGAFTQRYWAGRSLESDWKPGAEVRLHPAPGEAPEVRGEVLVYDPPRKLAYTWHETQEDVEPSTVTFELQPMESSVRLTVVHEPLAENDSARMGWPAILSSLKSFLEAGRPLGITEKWRRRAS